MQPTSQAPLLQLGTFDVRNYGDLLFPAIARWRCEAVGRAVIAVSPTNQDVGWADCVRPISFDEALKLANAGGVLIGGGSIVHGRRVRLPDYSRGTTPDWAYLSLWFGASLLAAMRDIPIAWNAPGVPLPLGSGREGDVLPAYILKAADYVSVRDRASAEHLGGAPAVVPDTALDISRMWPRGDLETVFRSMLDRFGMRPDGKYVAIHVKARSVSDYALADLARDLDGFCTVTGTTLILVAIGPCHGDDIVARQLSMLLRAEHICLSSPLGLREIASAIAWSDLYIGCSLHGYITAFSYGTPALLIAKPDQPKLGGFLDHVGRTQDLVMEWATAWRLGAGMMASTGEERPPLDQALISKLDEHWHHVAAAMSTPSAQKARGRLLLKHAREAIRSQGVNWLLTPQLMPA